MQLAAVKMILGATLVAVLVMQLGCMCKDHEVKQGRCVFVAMLGPNRAAKLASPREQSAQFAQLARLEVTTHSTAYVCGAVSGLFIEGTGQQNIPS